MPDSDRLQELRRQRALVQEQLAWLDREIAAVAGTAPVVAPVTRSVRPAPSVAMADADAMIAEFAAEEQKRGAISKQGCWTVFLGVMAVVGLLTALFAYFRYR